MFQELLPDCPLMHGPKMTYWRSVKPDTPTQAEWNADKLAPKVLQTCNRTHCEAKAY